MGATALGAAAGAESGEEAEAVGEERDFPVARGGCCSGACGSSALSNGAAALSSTTCSVVAAAESIPAAVPFEAPGNAAPAPGVVASAAGTAASILAPFDASAAEAASDATRRLYRGVSRRRAHASCWPSSAHSSAVSDSNVAVSMAFSSSSKRTQLACPFALAVMSGVAKPSSRSTSAPYSSSKRTCATGRGMRPCATCGSSAGHQGEGRVWSPSRDKSPVWTALKRPAARW
mmetsp:Transcript_53836/g.123876  ORF Transcript_53836/g.123876 Transcript_53836/m.123876 type:complete len:233 (-) Transcript_53836:914-1612(-)